MEFLFGVVAGVGLGVGVASLVWGRYLEGFSRRLSELLRESVRDVAGAVAHPGGVGDVEQVESVARFAFRDVEDPERGEDFSPAWMREEFQP